MGEEKLAGHAHGSAEAFQQQMEQAHASAFGFPLQPGDPLINAKIENGRIVGGYIERAEPMQPLYDGPSQLDRIEAKLDRLIKAMEGK